MQYTVYILYSASVDRFYIGYSSDIDRRLEQHNSNQSEYTKNKGPWQLVYREAYSDKSIAIKRERFLKAQRNREFYLRLIRGE